MLNSKYSAALIIICFFIVSCGQQNSTPAEPQSATPAELDTIKPKPQPQPVALPPQYADANLAVGKREFAKCKACHTLEEGQARKIGPNLYGIFGKPAAAVPNFKYSKAMLEKPIIWDHANFDQWIFNPRQFLPGTSMAFSGIKNPEKRRALLAYIYIQTGGELEKKSDGFE